MNDQYATPRSAIRRVLWALSATSAAAVIATLLLTRGLAAEKNSSPPPAAGAAQGKAGSAESSEPAVRLGSDASRAFGLSLPDSNGTPVLLKSLRGDKGTVLVFLSTECPISNGYVPVVSRLAEDSAAKGLTFVLVNANAGQSLKEIAVHRKEYAITLPVLRDAGAELAGIVGATHTPEAVVLDGAAKIVYRGRIDDRYSRRGGAANKVTRNDLAEALAEVAAGKPVAVAQTETVGCPIVVRRRKAASSADPSAVTWSQHVEPLVRDHCQRCHHPGGVGPFSLTSYEQAVSWADDLKTFTQDRTMPPWLPVEGWGEFHNRRSLSETQIETIGRWVDSGCPRGDASQPSRPAEFAGGWSLGKPDLILEPSREYRLGAEGGDVYRCFVLPTGLREDLFVKAIEVQPGNARVVHHVIAFLDTTGQSRVLDEKDPEEGYATTAGFPGFLPSGGIGGWAPGNQPRMLPEGMGKPLPTGATVVMQVHYHKSGRDEVDRTKLGLYFAKEKITRAVRTVPVMPFGGRLSGMTIPAGAANHEVTASLTLPRDVMAITVTPHMHLIGRDMTLTAELPDGREERMLKIGRWDFNWQEGYRYQEPLPLPAGTKLKLVAHFDNSAGNPSNPNTPPKQIGWGEQTTDEMCIAFLEVVPKGEAQLPVDLKLQRPSELMKDAIRQKMIEKVREKLPR